MIHKLFKIIFSCFVLALLLSFQNIEEDIYSELEGTTWVLKKADAVTGSLIFDRVDRLSKDKVSYKFKKNNDMVLTQVWSSCFGENIESNKTSGTWRSLDRNTIQLTYQSSKHKSVNRRSNIVIVKKFEIHDFLDNKLVMKEVK